MKVIQLGKYLPPHNGGIETVTSQIIRLNENRADIVTICCSHKKKTEISVFSSSKVICCPVVCTLFSMPVSVSYIFNAIRELRSADVVHLHLPFPIIDFILLLSRFSGRVVVHWHSDIVRQEKMAKLLHPLLKNTLKRADKVVFSAINNYKFVKFQCPLYEKSVIIPYGIDPTVQIPGHDVLARYMCKSDSIRVLFVGRFVYYKGIDILIQSIAKADNCELFLVGDGVLRKELERLVCDLRLESRVHFCGELLSNDVNSAFYHCDIFCLPSVEVSESFGLVQLEAMKMSKPVINTWLKSGVPEVSVDGISGITVPPNDVDALFEAILLLASNENLRHSLGASGRKRIMELYGEKMMADKIFECWCDD